MTVYMGDHNRKLVWIFGFIVLMFTSGYSQSTQANQYDESFDPLKLHEPKDMFFKEQSQQEVLRQLETDTSFISKEQRPASEQVTGYRVQLIATPNYQEADSMFQTIKSTFEADANTYLEYDSPNYKIRIGDCDTRYGAERLQNIARQKGFRYAWIVRSNILLQQ